MELSQLAENRLPTMKRYKEDKNLLPEQRKALVKFDEYNAARSLTVCSRFNYLKSIRLLAVAIRKPYESMNFDDLLHYYANLKKYHPRNPKANGEPVSNETKWNYQTSAIIFFRWLNKDDLAEKIRNIRVKKSKNGRVKREDLLTPSEIKKLLLACINKRDKLFISLLYECNARRGEVMGLKIKDVTFDEYGAVLKIRKGKTESSERNVPVIDSAPLLKDYLETEHPAKGEDEAYLFLTAVDQGYRGLKKPKRLEVSNALRIVRDTAKRAGFKKRVYPHLLRHSRTTNLLIDGVPAPIVQKLGGWADIQQISLRYGHVCSEDARTFFLRERGLLNDKEERDNSLDVKKCPRCLENNASTTNYCSKCWLPLDTKTAFKEREAEKEIKKVFSYAVKNPKMSFLEIMEKMKS